MTPENPIGPIVKLELQQAAFRNGWRIEQSEQNGWLLRGSHNAPGRVGLAGISSTGPWVVSVEHGGVAQQLGLPPADIDGPGLRRFVVESTAELHNILSRIHDLALALPDDPLRRFEKETRQLPKTTEAERKVLQRVGQGIFRDALMRYWQSRCPLTGIHDTELLRASHMKPWADCASDAERLDVYNGLLLSALWDAAFDRGLVTFSESGAPHFSTRLSDLSRQRLCHGVAGSLTLTDAHQTYLAFHREHVFRT